MELKPCQCACPGADYDYSETRRRVRVYCLECGSCSAWEASEADAAERWNHRPIEDALRAELEAAKKALFNAGILAITDAGEVETLRAEIAAERARLEWALGLLTWGSEDEPSLMTDKGCGCCAEFNDIPTGQTARDVIDILLKEAGDAG